jgi:hypothetical protein
VVAQLAEKAVVTAEELEQQLTRLRLPCRRRRSVWRVELPRLSRTLGNTAFRVIRFQNRSRLRGVLMKCLRVLTFSNLVLAFIASPASAQPLVPFDLFGTVTLNSTPGVPTPIDTLVNIDPLTGEQTLVGPTGAALRVRALDSDPLTGALFGTNVFDSPGVVYEIDPTVGLATAVANLAVRIHAIAFAPDGTLFGVDSSNGFTRNVLGSINLESQTFSPIMTIEDGVFVASIDFPPVGVLYAVYQQPSSGLTSLVVIDLGTSLTRIRRLHALSGCSRGLLTLPVRVIVTLSWSMTARLRLKDF